MHKVVKKLYLPTAASLLVGAAVGGGGPSPGVVFSANPALDTTDNNPGSTFRVVCDLTADPTDSIRVQFAGQSGNAFTILNAGVGKWAGSASNTTGAPLELLFGGVSGIEDMTAATWSDALDISSLSVSASDKLVVTFSVGPSGHSAQLLQGTATNSRTFFKSPSTEWNLASPSGFTDIGLKNYDVVQIEGL